MEKLRLRAWNGSQMIHHEPARSVGNPTMNFNGNVFHKGKYMKEWEIMFSSGLQDEEGTEVFGGDYLLINGVHKVEVVFVLGAFKYIEMSPMFSMKFGDGWLHELVSPASNILKNIKVIGNRHEGELQ